MGKFSHLQKHKISGDVTTEYAIYQISTEPVLTVCPATEANRPYFQGLLKRTGKDARRNRKVNAVMIKTVRDDDRDLYAKFIVKGWDENVVDNEGNPVAFSPEECREFLGALPDHIFDDLRNFCAEIDNFVSEDGDLDLEAAAEN